MTTERSPDPPVGVTREQISAFLAEQFGPDVSGVEPVGVGEWSRAFGFRTGGADLVARFGQHVEDFEKDRLAARWAAPNLPIPRVSEVGEALGGWYAVSERAHGRFLDDLSGDEMRAALPSLLAMLDALRAADVSGTTGYGGWGASGDAARPSWRDFLMDVAAEWDGARIAGWRQELTDTPTGIGPFDEAASRLAELLPHCPEERHLIHSDLLHWNVLVAGDRIAAVVDWGCGMYGDFLYDLAWIAFWAPWFPAWDGIDWVQEGRRHIDAAGVAVPRYAERMRAYRIHIGLDGQRYNAWKGRPGEVAAIAVRTLRIAREDEA